MAQTHITFLNNDGGIALKINNIDRQPHHKVIGQDWLLVKATLSFFGSKSEVELYFGLVPSTSYDLLLTVTVGNEYEINYYLTDKAFSFTEHSGGITFMTFQEIVQMFKERLNRDPKKRQK